MRPPFMEGASIFQLFPYRFITGRNLPSPRASLSEGFVPVHQHTALAVVVAQLAP